MTSKNRTAFEGVLDYDTGEILDLVRIRRHYTKYNTLCNLPYLNPSDTKYLTEDQIKDIRKHYGIAWHVLSNDLSIEDLLDSGLFLSDLQVFNCLCKNVIHNNISVISRQTIKEKTGLSYATITRSFIKLEEYNLIHKIGNFNKVHPLYGYLGHNRDKDDEFYHWVSKKSILDYEEKDYSHKMKKFYKWKKDYEKGCDFSWVKKV